MNERSRCRTVLAVAVLAMAGMQARVHGQENATVDREYVLEAHILGYRGVGGEIDGVRNPPLLAIRGETVRIVLVNGELMVHDIALETQSKVKSPQILEKGAKTSVTFKAEQSDTYYCTVPGHRLAGMQGRLEVTDAPRTTSPGVPPMADDRPLNLDFESGTLDSWTATGDAFTLVKADPDGKAGTAGGYSVSSAPSGSARKGTLSSAPFRVTHPYASFLVSGGAFTSTRVELVLADERKVIYSISGADQGRLRPAVADLTAYQGKDIFVRLVDDESGAPTAVYLKESPWAHISFDHFRFHETRPFYVNELTAAELDTLPPWIRSCTPGCRHLTRRAR